MALWSLIDLWVNVSHACLNTSFSHYSLISQNFPCLLAIGIYRVKKNALEQVSLLLLCLVFPLWFFVHLAQFLSNINLLLPLLLKWAGSLLSASTFVANTMAGLFRWGLSTMRPLFILYSDLMGCNITAWSILFLIASLFLFNWQYS